MVNPGGTLYLTANSASGSKYYEFVTPMQDYVAARWQEWKPIYSVIEIDNQAFTVNTYEVDTGKQIDGTYTIVKNVSAKSPAQSPAQAAHARQYLAGRMINL